MDQKTRDVLDAADKWLTAAEAMTAADEDWRRTDSEQAALAGIGSGRCCSATTHRMANSFTAAGPARACPSPSLSECGSVFGPLSVDKMPLSDPPPRGSRFGSPLVLNRVHWVRPEMVVEVSYAEWTPDGLLRHVVYLGEREDKPAIEVRRDRP
jgi:hypothetical protein